MENNAFIKPPKRIPFYIKIGLVISKRITKKDLLAPKLLAWYPKVALSSGVLESLIAHGNKDLNERILKLISQTPVNITAEFMEKVKSEFTEREIVIVSSTAAQVNYWARMLIALGVPPAGFSDKCDLRTTR
jgi:hypothetical protein